MNSDLYNYIQQNIFPKYHCFDNAHNINHIQTVINESLSLAKLYHLNEDMVYVIAAYHDIGILQGRELHHIYSAEYLMNDKNLLQWFTMEELQIMKEAIEDHRASAKNTPRSIYGCLIADADRDLDPESVIKRTIQFGKYNYPNSNKEQHYKRMKEHLYEKYAIGGYLRLNLDKSKAVQQLQMLQNIIADEQQLKIVFERLFVEVFKEE